MISKVLLAVLCLIAVLCMVDAQWGYGGFGRGYYGGYGGHYGGYGYRPYFRRSFYGAHSKGSSFQGTDHTSVDRSMEGILVMDTEAATVMVTDFTDNSSVRGFLTDRHAYLLI
ncbi:unnamed protein product [Haemonchus placei]|uniref:Glycine rich protein n=1 Tax=Haemonchus placei TaxID=6290 RepID=A0A0N4W4S1_HAEPC|nr:unnamed protein product [Haemonchus placei]